MHSNRDDLVVIGPRLLPLVRELDDPYLALYPVAIHDHDGKVASADYHTVHTTRIVDCIDVEASGCDRHISPSRHGPDELIRWHHLILKSGDHAFAKVFRIKHVPGKIFVREDFMMAIEARVERREQLHFAEVKPPGMRITDAGVLRCGPLPDLLDEYVGGVPEREVERQRVRVRARPLVFASALNRSTSDTTQSVRRFAAAGVAYSSS